MKQKLLIALAVLITCGVVFAAAKTTFYTILDMTNHKITNVATPTANADAATKAYADTKLAKTGGTMTGAINMGSQKITSLGTPSASTDGATKGYVDLGDSTRLPLSGGTMNGQLGMGGYRIYNMADPVSSQDSATKRYVDYAISQFVNEYSPFNFFALRKGSAYPPLVNIDHHDNTNLTFVVLKQFYGKIVASGENINANVSASDSSVKTWKVGESFSVSFLPTQEPTTATNGSIVVSLEKDEATLAQSNFGITFVPNGGAPVPELSVAIAGTTYATGTSANISSAFNPDLKTITIDITNTSLADVDGAVLYVSTIREYNSENILNGTVTVFGTTYGTDEAITLPHMSAGGTGLSAVVTVPTYDSGHGLRMNFYLSYGGSIYNYGQFFIPGNM